MNLNAKSTAREPFEPFFGSKGCECTQSPNWSALDADFLL
jgi:hypothetical protein